MEQCGNIYLVGMMGAGKTTVGRYLAKRFSRRFVDADHEIEARTGVRIPTIFEIEGETGFRKREAQVIAELAAEDDLVLATGGGAVLDASTRSVLAASGLVVYLNAPPAMLFERTRHDRNRPLLRVPNPLAKIEELYVARDPLYREIADVVIDPVGGGVTHLVAKVETEIRARCEP
ncbi:MAG: shikimate kinase [Rhodocyclaceae bacterium]|nr:shikimate kinase [Rhodocyclaceae bacterium]